MPHELHFVYIPTQSKDRSKWHYYIFTYSTIIMSPIGYKRVTYSVWLKTRERYAKMLGISTKDCTYKGRYKNGKPVYGLIELIEELKKEMKEK